MESKQAVISRLKRILGQVQGLQRMVEADRSAQEILMQTKSVEAALWQLAVFMTREEGFSGTCQEPQKFHALLTNVLNSFTSSQPGIL